MEQREALVGGKIKEKCGKLELGLVERVRCIWESSELPV
jgi:hypothetical protein